MALVVGTNSYVDVATTTTYFADRLHSAGWDGAADDAERATALISAADWMERQAWEGAVVTPGQALAWPRTGVTDGSGTAVSSASVPARIIQAQQELANALLNNISLLTADGSEGAIKSLAGGRINVQYFRSPQTGRLPAIVLSLVGDLLHRGSSVGNVYGITDDDGEDIVSSFEDADKFGLSGPYG